MPQVAQRSDEEIGVAAGFGIGAVSLEQVQRMLDGDGAAVAQFLGYAQELVKCGHVRNANRQRRRPAQADVADPWLQRLGEHLLKGLQAGQRVLMRPFFRFDAFQQPQHPAAPAVVGHRHVRRHGAQAFSEFGRRSFRTDPPGPAQQGIEQPQQALVGREVEATQTGQTDVQGVARVVLFGTHDEVVPLFLEAPIHLSSGKRSPVAGVGAVAVTVVVLAQPAPVGEVHVAQLVGTARKLEQDDGGQRLVQAIKVGLHANAMAQGGVGGLAGREPMAQPLIDAITRCWVGAGLCQGTGEELRIVETRELASIAAAGKQIRHCGIGVALQRDEPGGNGIQRHGGPLRQSADPMSSPKPAPPGSAWSPFKCRSRSARRQCGGTETLISPNAIRCLGR